MFVCVQVWMNVCMYVAMDIAYVYVGSFSQYAPINTVSRSLPRVRVFTVSSSLLTIVPVEINVGLCPIVKMHSRSRKHSFYKVYLTTVR